MKVITTNLVLLDVINAKIKNKINKCTINLHFNNVCMNFTKLIHNHLMYIHLTIN